MKEHLFSALLITKMMFCLSVLVGVACASSPDRWPTEEVGDVDSGALSLEEVGDDEALSLIQLRAHKHNADQEPVDACKECFAVHRRGIFPLGVGFCPKFEKWGAVSTNVCKPGTGWESIDKCATPAVIANRENPVPDCDSLGTTGGDAAAIGDPHMTTNTGSRFDLH